MELLPAVEWSTRESTHFRIHYQPRSYAEQQLATVITQAERTYRTLVDGLRMDAGLAAGDNRIDLYLVDYLDDERDPDHKIATGGRVRDGAIWQVYTPESPGASLDRSLLRVLVTRAYSPNAAAAPMFVDGLAAYLAGGKAAARSVAATDARVRELVDTGGSVVSIFPLLEPNGESAPNYDPVAHSFVGFLITRSNLDSLKQFFAKYDPKARDAAAQGVYHRSLGQLEEEWRAALKKTKPAGISFKDFLTQVLFYIKPFMRYEIEIFLLLLIGLAFQLIMPLANAYLIDSIIIGGPANLDQKTNLLFIFLGGLFAFFVVNNLASFRRTFLSGFVSESILRRLRLQLFTKLQNLSASYYANTKIGDIQTRLTSDLVIIQGLLSDTLVAGIFQVLTLIFASIILLRLNLILGVIVLAALPALTFSYSVLRKRAAEASRERQQRMADVAGALNENLNAHPVVKAFRLENLMISHWTARLDALFAISRRVSILSAIFATSITLIAAFIQLVVLGTGGYFVIHGNLQLGELIAFLGLMGSAFAPVATLSTISQLIQQASGSMERVIELLEEQPTIVDRPDARPIPPLKELIEFENVTFSYTGEQPTLSDLSLTIPAGASVAFVGPSGAGKSSTIQLLLRFYDPDSGRVTFDGVDLRDATLASVRDQIAIVFQDTFVFNTSMRENIAYGKPGATDEEIVAAAQAAKLHDFIMSQPRGYDTVVGERGARMSGGQRQRLSIARAMLKNPTILILDEATSALDPQTEAEIQETLADIAKGRTTISITHRLSSVVTCDRIFVLDRGKLVEAGTHGELVRSGGLYQRLFEEQTGYIASSGQVRHGVESSRLRAVPLFAELPPDVLDAVAANLASERHAAGDVICQQGDPGDTMYIIHRGEVEVVVKGADGEERVVNKLHNGDYFGEIALLHDLTRTATVRTTEPTQLYGLSKTEFTPLLKRLPALGDAIQRVGTARLQDTASKLATKPS